MPQLHPGRVWPLHFRRDLAFQHETVGRPPDALQWAWSSNNLGTIGSLTPTIGEVGSFSGDDGQPDMSIEWGWPLIHHAGFTFNLNILLKVDPTDRQLHMIATVFVPGQVTVTWELKPPVVWGYVSTPFHANFTTTNATKWHVDPFSNGDVYIRGSRWGE